MRPAARRKQCAARASARDALAAETRQPTPPGSAKWRCYDRRMNNPFIVSMSNEELIAAARELSRRSRAVEAELLLHLGEIDERKLYLDRAFSSMFAFCTRELGFSEGAAYNRILVARAGRKLPAIIDAVRAGQVHLAGLRLLAPHLTEENHPHLLRTRSSGPSTSGTAASARSSTSE